MSALCKQCSLIPSTSLHSFHEGLERQSRRERGRARVEGSEGGRREGKENEEILEEEVRGSNGRKTTTKRKRERKDGRWKLSAVSNQNGERGQSEMERREGRKRGREGGREGES